MCSLNTFLSNRTDNDFPGSNFRRTATLFQRLYDFHNVSGQLARALK